MPTEGGVVPTEGRVVPWLSLRRAARYRQMGRLWVNLKRGAIQLHQLEQADAVASCRVARQLGASMQSILDSHLVWRSGPLRLPWVWVGISG